MDKHKILFVDDEKNILSTLKKSMMDESLEIFTASSGYEGLELLKDHDFSVILSDYRMPELNGVEFLKLAKDKNPDTMRMIFTGYADMDMIISAVNDGEVYKFIEKPWKNTLLRIHIKKALEHYELIKERQVLIEKIKIKNEELETLNENLEEQVEIKTSKLMGAYTDLELKVKELQGRDKVLEALLNIHPFDEMIELILCVIAEIIAHEKIVVYVADNGVMVPKAGVSKKNSEERKISKKKIELLPRFPIPSLNEKSPDRCNQVDESTVVMPIKKEAECLGMFYLEKSKSQNSFEEKDVEVLSGFTSLAALAINDHLISLGSADMKKDIDGLLEDLN